MALLFYSEVDDADAWASSLTAKIPGLDVRTHPNSGDPAEIDAALVWLPPPNLLQQFPNLKLILSLAAGIDALLQDPTLPDVPICRMVDSSLSFGMAEFVLTTSLHIHRDLHHYRRQQQQRRWNLILPQLPETKSIGIMGLGEMGRAAAEMLARHGFNTHGWSKSPKSLPNITCHHGDTGLQTMLNQCQILACLLPLTEQTTGMLNQDLFNQLPQGASLIQAGRGPQLVETDLLDALDRGKLDHAFLDVFQTEPLPEDHRFWHHPKITITPHAASYSTPQSGSVSIAENLKRLTDGRPFLHTVDRTRGY